MQRYRLIAGEAAGCRLGVLPAVMDRTRTSIRVDLGKRHACQNRTRIQPRRFRERRRHARGVGLRGFSNRLLEPMAEPGMPCVMKSFHCQRHQRSQLRADGIPVDLSNCQLT